MKETDALNPQALDRYGDQALDRVSDLISKITQVESYLLATMQRAIPMSPHQRLQVFSAINHLEESLSAFKGKMKDEAIK